MVPVPDPTDGSISTIFSKKLMAYKPKAGVKVKLKNESLSENTGGWTPNGFDCCPVSGAKSEANSGRLGLYLLVQFAQALHQQFHEHAQFGHVHLFFGKAGRELKAPLLLA